MGRLAGSAPALLLLKPLLSAGTESAAALVPFAAGSA